MPKSKTHLKRRIRMNNLIQVVMTAPARIRTSSKRYLTAKGRKLLDANLIDKKEAWRKYGKYRYKDNPKAMPTTNIKHSFV